MATDKPDTIGWSLGIVFTFVLTLAGTLYGMSKAGYKRVGTPGATGVGATAPPGAVSFFVDTLTYIPHIMLLFGVLADMLTYQGVYSIPSLIGLISIVLNFFMKFFWAGVSDVFVKLGELFYGKPATPGNNSVDGAAAAAANTVGNAAAAAANTVGNAANTVAAAVGLGNGPPSSSSKPPSAAATNKPAVNNPNPVGGKQRGGGKFFEEYDGCSVQGLSFLRNPYAPQTLVFTATVFFYYIFDLIQNRGIVNATATIVLGGILFFAQAAVIGNCNQKTDEPGRWTQTFASFVEGVLFGGVGYSVVQTYFPGRLPSTAVSPFPKKTPEDLTPSANGGFKDSSGNPYVCLPNGQCFPDLSTQESRSAFATIAAANLGTGAPAVAENCSATASAPS
jgi:hypothetical protein